MLGSIPTDAARSWRSGSSVVYLDSDDANSGDASAADSAPAWHARGRPATPGGRVPAVVDAEELDARESSGSSLARRSIDAGRIAAEELMQIHALVQARSERVSVKERDLQRSEIAVLQAVANAKVALRTEAEGLLQASHRDLKREVTLQRRRLDDLLEKTREEFRKVIVWRREIRTMKDSMAAAAEEQARTVQRLQDAERRCKASADREKMHRQALAEERERWEKERQRLESQHRRLQRRVQELQGVGPRASKGHQAVGSTHVPNMPPPAPCADRLFGAAAVDSDGVSGHEVPLMGAWWTLDALAGGEGGAAATDPRVLWGYAALLSESMLGGRGHECPRGVEESQMHGLAACFVRRWSWRLLTRNAQQRAASTRRSSAAVGTGIESPPDLAFGAARPSTELEDRNALAWARQVRRRASALQDCWVEARSEGTSGSVYVPPETQRHPSPSRAIPAATPFDLHDWLPGQRGADGPLGALRAYIATHLLGEDTSGDVSIEGSSTAACVVLVPIEAQRRLATVLWRDARRQLLDLEPALREAQAEPGSLAEACRTLLTAAALLLATEADAGFAALRALLRLCAGSGPVLREGGLPEEQTLPVLLWLEDATHCPSRRSNLSAARELLAALFPVLAPHGEQRHVQRARDTLVEQL